MRDRSRKIDTIRPDRLPRNGEEIDELVRKIREWGLEQLSGGNRGGHNTLMSIAAVMEALRGRVSILETVDDERRELIEEILGADAKLDGEHSCRVDQMVTDEQQRWRCSECGAWFKESEGRVEIQPERTLARTERTPIVVPGGRMVH